MPRTLKNDSVRDKVAALHARLIPLGKAIVAYSGGVDSTFLLHEAALAMGARNVVAVTAVSETYTAEEKERAGAICRGLKIRHELLATQESADPNFVRNAPDRCYHCKKELFRRVHELARGLGVTAVLEASHASDLLDFRPGRQAIAELGILSPLAETGFTKDDIRAASRERGLPTADLPAAACLASRIAYGIEVTSDLLDRLARGESAVRRLGFREFRLRHHGDVARLEFAPSELPRAFRFRRALHERVAAEGWTFVALDLRGYRTGSLNEPLRRRALEQGKK